MTKIGFTLGVFALVVGCGQTQRATSLPSVGLTPTSKWSTTENLSAPESVYFDAQSGQTFVSNVAGNPGEKDGNGWIATLTLDKTGKPVVTKIIKGLDAPKGLRAKHGILWIADIDTMIKVDAKTHRILARIPIPGASFLNDPAVADDGAVYVTDTIASKIYVLQGDKSEVFAEGKDLESPNGLLLVGNRLYVASWGFITDPSTFGAKVPGHLYYLDLKTKAKTLVTNAPLGHLDSIEQAANGDLLVSD